jgi:hypothetical protein
MTEGKMVLGGQKLWLEEGEVCVQGCWFWEMTVEMGWGWRLRGEGDNKGGLWKGEEDQEKAGGKGLSGWFVLVKIGLGLGFFLYFF